MVLVDYIGIFLQVARLLSPYCSLQQLHVSNWDMFHELTTLAISAYKHLSCEFESFSGEVYSMQHYVIKFVSDLRRVGGFLRALWFLPPIKLTATI